MSILSTGKLLRYANNDIEFNQLEKTHSEKHHPLPKKYIIDTIINRGICPNFYKHIDSLFSKYTFQLLLLEFPKCITMKTKVIYKYIKL